MGESLPPDEDRGPRLVAVVWSLNAVAFFVVAARFYARRLIRGIGLDDWMVLISMIFFTIVSATATKIAHLGGFRHLVYVPPEGVRDLIFYSNLGSVFGISAAGTCKFAVGYQLLRVLEGTAHWRKMFIWILIVVTLVYSLIEGVMSMFHCNPAKKSWEPLTPGTCWSLDTTIINLYVVGSKCNTNVIYHVVVDVILAILPLPTIWSLSVSFGTRIRLCIILGLGLFAAVFGSIKLTYVKAFHNLEDITWAIADLDLWSVAELFMVIFCCSIPPLHVLWRRMTGKPISSHTSNNARFRGLKEISTGRDASHKGSVFTFSISQQTRAPKHDDESRLCWPAAGGQSVAGDSELLELGKRINATTEISITSTKDDGEYYNSLPIPAIVRG
ncbi:hypothetical protein K458DRAFT_463462 [Lentithecium fluviatile CBS 122367]|uniref:Rhodopsin domain-containing protein n=1 Tax=Lentithecium fluviatile CBS 122367 TaxID=1168545 RepID=A0A6G1IKT8_9PLEO|nr:hypothetical protein K458DRAFT_463462 [Lentithecium fluviatile CBS 122367]